MGIGEFRHRVELFAITYTEDEYGGRTKHQTSLGEYWANVEEENISKTTGEHSEMQNGIKVQIRRKVLPEAFTLAYNGNIYTPLSVKNDLEYTYVILIR